MKKEDLVKELVGLCEESGAFEYSDCFKLPRLKRGDGNSASIYGSHRTFQIAYSDRIIVITEKWYGHRVAYYGADLKKRAVYYALTVNGVIKKVREMATSDG